MRSLDVGLSGQVSATVLSSDTAEAVGSGSVPALATPRVLALMEAAAVAAVADSLAEGTTTVGVAANLTHSRATRVGGRVQARATLIAIDGRRLDFNCRLVDESTGTELATCEHSRVVVNTEEFMRRLGS